MNSLKISSVLKRSMKRKRMVAMMKANKMINLHMVTEEWVSYLKRLDSDFKSVCLIPIILVIVLNK